MGGIFISYRRDDTAGHAGRLCDRLRAHFGREQVFMDLDTIPPGRDFVDAIEQAVAACDALVVLIGRDWLAASHPDGGRRLDDPEDFVRLEVAAALRRGTLVIPVLVEGARMPSSRDLPEDIARLARHNALEVSDGRWDYDTDRLVAALSPAVGAAAPSGGPPPPAPGPTEPAPAASRAGPPGLAEALPGTWSVQLQHPAVGTGQGSLIIDAGGVFQGQMASPMGVWAVSGQWQLVGPAHLQMAGTQHNGMAVLPYQVFIQFGTVERDRLMGTTSAGETALFVRTT